MNLIANSPPQQLLYHYCPSESFFGIASSKVLWLSNSEYANDPNENKIAYDILEDIAKDSTKPDSARFAKTVLDLEFSLVDRMSSYVFCMSENPEDLNQWRVYADNGYGFMLGLRPQYFLQKGLWVLLEQNTPFPGVDKLYLSKCIYDYQQQRSIVLSLLSQFQGQQEADKLENIVKLKFMLKCYSSVFKHQSYAVENEWRVVCFPVTQPQTHGVTVNYQTRFRHRRGVIVQYVEQALGKGSDLRDSPFESIVLGSNVLNDQHEIANFLQFKQAQFYTVSKSKLLLREV